MLRAIAAYIAGFITAIGLAAGAAVTTITTTSPEDARIVAAFGRGLLALGRDATQAEVKGAFTGDITERAGPSITLPANSLGVNGRVNAIFESNGNTTAGNKIFRLRWDGLGGTAFAASTVTTHGTGHGDFRIDNAGATNKNRGTGMIAATSAILASPAVLGTIDSTGSTSVVISLQKATATDHAIIEGWQILISANGL